MNRKFYIDLIYINILGMATSMSLPPFNYLIINFITLSLFFIFLFQKSKILKSKKKFFLYGWSFGFGYFITNLYWISISLTFDQDLKMFIPITIILIPAFLSIFYGLISYIFITLKPKKILNAFLIFSLIFGIIEFIRGLILTGFPWNLIAYSFSKQLEILSITSILGTYGFNLFCISLFVSPIFLILRDNKKEVMIPVFFILTVSFFYIYGLSYEKKFKDADTHHYDYKIRLLGSNISLDRFYLNIEPISVIKELIEISESNKDEKTIFVWPEGILPEISQQELIDYKFLFDKHFGDNHFLIIGINHRSKENGKIGHFNTLSIYDNNLELVNSYNKINLVPFGEFLPLENILRSIGFKTITNNYNSFSKGNKRDIIKLNKQNFSLKILPLICYEIIYSGRIMENYDFDLIINISEDGWFGKSIGPEQHFTHSIFRSIESGKYVLRSANNGIAAVVNPLGAVEQRIELGQTGYIDFNKNKKIQPTLFSKYGNKIFLLVILLYIFLIFSFNKTKNE